MSERMQFMSTLQDPLSMQWSTACRKLGIEATYILKKRKYNIPKDVLIRLNACYNCGTSRIQCIYIHGNDLIHIYLYINSLSNHFIVSPMMITYSCVHACVHLLFPLQDGNTSLRYAAMGCHTTCVEHLLSTPSIDVNSMDRVSSCFLNRI